MDQYQSSISERVIRSQSGTLLEIAPKFQSYAKEAIKTCLQSCFDIQRNHTNLHFIDGKIAIKVENQGPFGEKFTIIQNCFQKRSNFFENNPHHQKISKDVFLKIIELIIMENVSKNLIQYLNRQDGQIEGRRLQEMVVQTRNTIAINANWQKMFSDEAPEFIELQFERLNYRFTGLLELLDRKKFYLNLTKGINGFFCLTFSHQDEKITPKFQKGTQTNVCSKKPSSKCVSSRESKEDMKADSSDSSGAAAIRKVKFLVASAPLRVEMDNSDLSDLTKVSEVLSEENASLIVDQQQMVDRVPSLKIDVEEEKKEEIKENKKRHKSFKKMSQKQLVKLVKLNENKWKSRRNLDQKQLNDIEREELDQTLKQHFEKVSSFNSNFGQDESGSKHMQSQFVISGSHGGSQTSSLNYNNSNVSSSIIERNQITNFSCEMSQKYPNIQSRQSNSKISRRSNAQQNSSNFTIKNAERQASCLSIPVVKTNSLKIKARNFQNSALFHINSISENFGVNASQYSNKNQEDPQVYVGHIRDLKKKLQKSKLFMNMVIHDLRSPSEAIQHGLLQAQELMKCKITAILQETQQTFNNQILVRSEMRQISRDKSINSFKSYQYNYKSEDHNKKKKMDQNFSMPENSPDFPRKVEKFPQSMQNEVNDKSIQEGNEDYQLVIDLNIDRIVDEINEEDFEENSGVHLNQSHFNKNNFVMTQKEDSTKIEFIERIIKVGNLHPVDQSTQTDQVQINLHNSFQPPEEEKKEESKSNKVLMFKSINSIKCSPQQKIAIRSRDRSLEPNPTINIGSCPKCLSLAKFLLQQYDKFQKIFQIMDIYVQQSISSSQTLILLINDLLDLAKLEQSTFQLNNEYFNIFEVISETFEVMQYQAETKGIQLLIQYDVSKSFIFTKMFSDRRRFHQVITNFVSNSLKFTKQGGMVKVILGIDEEQKSNISKPKSKAPQKVTYNFKNKRKRKNSFNCFSNKAIDGINYEEEDKYVKLHIVIEDNGVGIKKENVAKLFTDFGKLDEHSDVNQKGTGLGMSICKNIIEQMGGKVYADSDEGQGTRINIELGLKCVDKNYYLPNDRALVNNAQNEAFLNEQNAFEYFQDFWKKYEIEQEVFDPQDLNENQSWVVLSPHQQIVKYNPMAKRNLFGAQIKDENQLLIDSLKNDLIEFINKEIIDVQNSQIRNESSKNKGSKSVLSMHLKCIEDIQDLDKFAALENNSDEEIKADLSWRNPQRIKIIQSEDDSYDNDSNSLYVMEKSLERKSREYIPQNQSLRQSYKYNPESHNPQNLQSLINSHQSSSLIVKKPNRKMSSMNFGQNYFIEDYNKSAEQQPQKYETQNTPLAKCIQILQKHQQRKLRVLVANDTEFQLLIISTSLQKISCIGTIDQAKNGQEAFNLVQKNEKQNGWYYDLIFLDLNMPIMNGYESCKQINQFYKHLFSERFLQNIDLEEESPENNWLEDLQQVYCDYIDQVSARSNTNQRDSLLQSQETDLETKFKKIFIRLFMNVKFNALSNMIRPPIYAYSSLVTPQIIKDCKDASFDDCLDSPLRVKDVQDIIENRLNLFAINHIENKFVDCFKGDIQLRRYHKLISNLGMKEEQSMSQVMKSLQSNHLPIQIPSQDSDSHLEEVKAPQEEEKQHSLSPKKIHYNSTIKEDQNEDLFSNFIKNGSSMDNFSQQQKSKQGNELNHNIGYESERLESLGRPGVQALSEDEESQEFILEDD